MPIHVNPAFTREVIVGFVVSLAAALLALAASVWSEWADERAHLEGRAPVASRVLCAAALGLFFLATLGQVAGYLLLEYTVWWTW